MSYPGVLQRARKTALNEPRTLVLLLCHQVICRIIALTDVLRCDTLASVGQFY